MSNYKRLQHTKWERKYHVVFIPKCRRKTLYGGHAHRSGDLLFPPSLEHLGETGRFRSFVSALYKKSWVVYAKPPMAGPEQVLAYLARYTHCVAIANSRLVSVEDGRVRFRYKDYARGCRQRTLVLHNDISARDVQLPQVQFYKGKSYRTFGPTGLWLTLVDADDLDHFDCVTVLHSTELKHFEQDGNGVTARLSRRDGQ